MDINKILSADILDIIFEGRNKAYGAYDLRKTYNRRIITSVIAMVALCLLIFGGSILANKLGDDSNKKKEVAQDIELQDVKQQDKKEEPPPPPPKPPEVEKLEETKIGTANQEGVKDEGIVAPPVSDDGKGVVEAPKKDETDYDKTFTKVEIESEYPGGTAAWQRYLNKNLHYPQEAIDNEIQGTIVVQFIVDKEGNVSDVEAISGPNELRDEAMRVIKKSGKWTPAVQNGRQVKSYKKQPIVFKLETEG